MRNELEGSKVRGSLSEQWQEPEERVTYIFSNCFFPDICPGVELLGHVVTLFLF